MTWTKLGSEFSDEAADLSDAAFRLHLEALMWSNRRLLDLVVPKKDMRKFANVENTDITIKELVTAGWWEDRGESWWIGCRFPEWQRDKVQVLHAREANALRQRRSRRHRLGDHELCDKDCTSRRDSRGDSHDDSRRAPERNGTERLVGDHLGGGEQPAAQPWPPVSLPPDRIRSVS